MSVIGDIFDSLTGKTASKAATEAAGISAGAQTDALNYLKDANAVPQQFKEQALTGLGDYFLNGNQDQIVNQVMGGANYKNMVGQGEEAVLRNAAATGGLRTGGANLGLAQNSQNILQSLIDKQLGGVSGLAGLGTNEQQIANTMGSIGMTQAQGLTAGAQSQQSALGNLLGAGAVAFSDIRLKSNIKEIGTLNGEKWHSWTWNKEAEKLGLKGNGEGVVIDKLTKKNHKHVSNYNGYMTFNYGGFINE